MSNKITIDRAALLKALQAATRVVERRQTYPILANAHLSAGDGFLHIRATDLDIEVSTKAECAGDLIPITVPAATLLEITRKLSGGDVTIELAGEHIVVKSGRSRFNIATLSADGFPTLAVDVFTARIETDLVSLFANIAFAISNEETRYYLNGVYFHQKDGKLAAVATDGHRLALNIGDEVEAFPAGIIPTKALGVIPAGVVSVEISTTKIRFTGDGITVTSKLIEGQFPDYDRVIPNGNENVVVFDRASLMAAVDRVGVIATDKGGKAIKLVIESSAMLSVSNVDHGDAQEEVECTHQGEAIIIGFNSRYLGDMLRACEGGDVTFKFGDSGSPTIVLGESADWLGVLMPMRV